MATPVVVVLALVALTSLAAVVAVTSLLLARLRRLAGDMRHVEQELMPTIERLQRNTDIAGREMERVSRSLDDLGE